MQVSIADMSMPDVITELVSSGALTQVAPDRFDLTEFGAQIIAEDKGWEFAEDDDGDPCFVDTLSYNHFSYVSTWRELVALKGLAVLTRTMAEVMQG